MPVEPERIENTLATRDSITPEYIREFLSSTQRGLGSIEYLIFADDALENHADPDLLHCEYIVSAADVVADEMAGVLQDWTGNGGQTDGYFGVFTGQASSSLLPLAAVSETVRTTIFLLRSIVDMQLGAALGMSDGEADPEAIRSGPGLSGVSDIRDQVLGMQDAYIGVATADGETLGIGASVRGISEDADERVMGRFQKAIAAIDHLEEPLHETLFRVAPNQSQCTKP